jgi:hypothetical protein
MQMTLSTPALLFPAISLLLLAYTNRFLALGARVRLLHSNMQTEQSEALRLQIKSLRKRIVLIRNMQLFGISSLFFCMCSMFALYMDWLTAGKIIFGGSLIFMIISLGTSFREILISIEALNIQLNDVSLQSSENNAER